MCVKSKSATEKKVVRCFATLVYAVWRAGACQFGVPAVCAVRENMRLSWSRHCAAAAAHSNSHRARFCEANNRQKETRVKGDTVEIAPRDQMQCALLCVWLLAFVSLLLPFSSFRDDAANAIDSAGSDALNECRQISRESALKFKY